MALFKKLNEQMEVSKIKRDNEISLEERELIENEIIFNNLVESLERSQDIAAMYGEHFKRDKKNLKETISLDDSKSEATILWNDSLSKVEKNFLSKYYLVGEDYSNGNYIIEDKKTGVIYSLDLEGSRQIGNSSIRRIANSIKNIKEDLNPEAMDNSEDEKQVKDFDQKETGATEEKEEQFEDKTEDIVVAVEKE